MLVTVLGMDTLVTLDPAYALAPMPATATPKRVDGTVIAPLDPVADVMVIAPFVAI